MLNAPEEAIKYLGIANIMEPSDPVPAVQIAECLLSMKRSSEAYDLLKKIDEEFGSLPKFKEITAKVKLMLNFEAQYEASK
jgi:superoxide dismutase